MRKSYRYNVLLRSNCLHLVTGAHGCIAENLSEDKEA